MKLNIKFFAPLILGVLFSFQGNGQNTVNAKAIFFKANVDTVTLSPKPNGTLEWGNGGNLYFKKGGVWFAVPLGAGGGSVTSVDVSGGSTGLNFTGGPIVASGVITASGILNPTAGGIGGAGGIAPSNGDIITGNGGDYTRLTLGAAGTVLGNSGGTLQWLTPNNAGVWGLGSNGTFTAPLTFTGSNVNLLTFVFPNQGATTPFGMEWKNTTPAAAGSQQDSPAETFTANGWKTNATAGSQAVQFKIFARGVQGAANPTGLFALNASINGGAYANAITIDNTGNMIHQGTVFTFGSAGLVTTTGGQNLGVNPNGSGILNLGTSSTGAVNIGSVSVGAVGIVTGGNNNITLTSGGTGNILVDHVSSKGTTATTLAAGTGAGTTPTITCTNCTGFTGKINVTTGTAPTASAIVVTGTLGRAFAVADYNVILSPANLITSGLSGASAVFAATTSTTQFTVTVGATNLTASTAYSWYYIITQ